MVTLEHRSRSTEAVTPRVVVVVGGGRAGVAAASSICSALRPHEAEATRVVLVNRSGMFLDRPLLHQVIGGLLTTAERPLRPMLPRSCELVLGTALVIDVDRDLLLVGSGSGVQELRYDLLVYAAGRMPEVGPPVDECAHLVADSEAARRAGRAVASAGPGQEIVVIDGGMAGVEVVAAIIQGHPDAAVTLTSAGQFLPSVRGAARVRIRRALDRCGVTVSAETPIAAVEPHCVILADTGEPLDAAVSISAEGGAVSDLASSSGLVTDEAGRLLVDDRLRAIGHPNVIGAGFAVAFASTAPRGSQGQAVRRAHGRHAAATVLTLLRGKQRRSRSIRFGVRAFSLGRLGNFVEFSTARGATLFALRLPNRSARWFAETVLGGRSR